MLRRDSVLLNLASPLWEVLTQYWDDFPPGASSPRFPRTSEPVPVGHSPRRGRGTRRMYILNGAPTYLFWVENLHSNGSVTYFFRSFSFYD